MPQLWPGCRLILVDDASNDGSERMCDEYAAAHPGLAVVLHIDHSGLSGARNRALDIVDTDYIAFCDADDLYLAGALPAMADVLETEYACDIVVAQFTQKLESRAVSGIEYEKVAAEDALERTLYQDNYYHNSTWAKVYRSKIFTNLRFVEGRYYEDLEIQPRIYLKADKIALSSEVVYYYRPNPTSFINTWSDKRLDAVFAAERVIAYVQEHCPRCIQAAQSRLFSAAFNIFNLAVRHNYQLQAHNCWNIITGLRRQMIRDPKVRKKNKIAAVMTYSGEKICSLIARFDKKS